MNSSNRKLASSSGLKDNEAIDLENHQSNQNVDGSNSSGDILDVANNDKKKKKNQKRRGTTALNNGSKDEYLVRVGG